MNYIKHIAITILACGIALLMGACSNAAPAKQEPEPEPKEASTQLTKKPLDEYSWTELKQISARISEAPTPEAQREVAQSFGLVEDDGTITTQTHKLNLDDGKYINVRIVGICHDDASDGSGKVGLTFMTVGGIGIYPMNDDATVEGGWEMSGLRERLASEKKRFDKELADAIVSVDKYTNNVGLTDSFESITPTEDELWVFSVHEVCGDVTWDIDEFRQRRGSEDVDGLVNSEGDQYEAFSQAGVTSETDPSGMLSLSSSTGTSSWWYRTPYPFEFSGYGDTGSNGYFYQVSASGFPQSLGSPEVPTTVVVGFCI